MDVIFRRIMKDPLVGLAVLLWLISIAADVATNAAAARMFDLWAVVGVIGGALTSLTSMLLALFAKSPNGAAIAISTGNTGATKIPPPEGK